MIGAPGEHEDVEPRGGETGHATRAARLDVGHVQRLVLAQRRPRRVRDEARDGRREPAVPRRLHRRSPRAPAPRFRSIRASSTRPPGPGGRRGESAPSSGTYGGKRQAGGGTCLVEDSGGGGGWPRRPAAGTGRMGWQARTMRAVRGPKWASGGHGDVGVAHCGAIDAVPGIASRAVRGHRGRPRRPCGRSAWARREPCADARPARPHAGARGVGDARGRRRADRRRIDLLPRRAVDSKERSRLRDPGRTPDPLLGLRRGRRPARRSQAREHPGARTGTRRP